jgi:hypothetical protein
MMPDVKHLVAGLHSRGVLPHLKREGGTYFVTFRQAGTLPKEVLLQFKQEREAILHQAEAAKRPLTWHEQEELFRWYSDRVDKYLDMGHGVCHLRNPELAEIVAGAIQFFEGQRYELRAWVVMPNHVHAVVWPKPGRTLSFSECVSLSRLLQNSEPTHAGCCIQFAFGRVTPHGMAGFRRPSWESRSGINARFPVHVSETLAD